MSAKMVVVLMWVLLGGFGMAFVTEAQEMNNADLSPRQQGIAAIAAFTAKGDMAGLESALERGLDAGLSVSEIKEVLVQMYAYAGFPRSLNGIGAFMRTLGERECRGLHDEAGREPAPFPADKTRLQLGTDIQTQLAGAPVVGPVMEFAPTIDRFLKEHLFGDIFGRDVLDYQEREIATIAALSSIEGVESQLRSHVGIGFNVGLTRAQMERLIVVLETDVGTTEATNARSALQAVAAARGD